MCLDCNYKQDTKSESKSERKKNILEFVSFYYTTLKRNVLKEYYEIFFIFTLEQIIVLNKYCT